MLEGLVYYITIDELIQMLDYWTFLSEIMEHYEPWVYDDPYKR